MQKIVTLATVVCVVGALGAGGVASAAPVSDALTIGPVANCSTPPDEPPSPIETCGNCVDDDGDGLVDWEDADCCWAAEPLAVRSLGVRRGRLRLRAAWFAQSMDGLEPAAGDTSLQIADGNEQLVCVTVPARYWKARRARVFAFRDREQTLGTALQQGRLTVRRNGRVSFRARGGADPRGTDGVPVRVVVRVGAQCAATTTPLRLRPAR